MFETRIPVTALDEARIGATAVIEIDRLDSVALRRLVEEVRNNEPLNVSAYNRTYHRHNR